MRRTVRAFGFTLVLVGMALITCHALAAEPHTYGLELSTYFGGSGGDLLRDMTADAQGNIYVAGIAGSGDFPRTHGVIPGRSDRAGGMVAKFSPTGTLIWSKVFAGEYLYSVKYVGGVTTSRDFPTKNAYQGEYGGDPGFGSVPNGGSAPVGWGNGDCWLAKFGPAPAAGEARPATQPPPRPAAAK